MNSQWPWRRPCDAEQRRRRDDVLAIYRGRDGAVFRNDRALPRYFFPALFEVEPSFDTTVAKLKLIADFRQSAVVDHVPPHVTEAAPDFERAAQTAPAACAGGSVMVASYDPNVTELDIDNRGWNLLVSSDSWWPGWRVYWNGTRLPPVRVTGSFVGAFLPPGHGRVRLRG